jgi:hypothetical protein
MTSLYRWLNKRHYDKFARKMSKAAGPGKRVVFHHVSWDELEARWEARAAREAAQPWVVRAGRSVRVYLFGWNGLVKVRMRPRYIVNQVVWYHQRARRGWADCDTWNLDGYVLHVIAPMLAHLAEHGYAYPGRVPFDTPEKWDEHLRDLSGRLSAWGEVDGLLTEAEAREVSKGALGEFARNLGMYWDLGYNLLLEEVCA